MGDIGEVTASTLSAHQDVLDMEAEGKRGLTDYTSMEADIDKLRAQSRNVNHSVSRSLGPRHTRGDAPAADSTYSFQSDGCSPFWDAVPPALIASMMYLVL